MRAKPSNSLWLQSVAAFVTRLHNSMGKWYQKVLDYKVAWPKNLVVNKSFDSHTIDILLGTVPMH